MITKKQWLKLVSKVEQTFEDEFKAEYNSPELMYPLVKRLLQQTDVSGSLPTSEQSKKAMLRRKTKFVDNMDKFSSRKNAYKQGWKGWKDCYEWIMSQDYDR